MNQPLSNPLLKAMENLRNGIDAVATPNWIVLSPQEYEIYRQITWGFPRRTGKTLMISEINKALDVSERSSNSKDLAEALMEQYANGHTFGGRVAALSPYWAAMGASFEKSRRERTSRLANFLAMFTTVPTSRRSITGQRIFTRFVPHAIIAGTLSTIPTIQKNVQRQAPHFCLSPESVSRTIPTPQQVRLTESSMRSSGGSPLLRGNSSRTSSPNYKIRTK